MDLLYLFNSRRKNLLHGTMAFPAGLQELIKLASTKLKKKHNNFRLRSQVANML